MDITIESIKNKLGFDPLNPPTPKLDPFDVDDSTPSRWEKLTREELAFLLLPQLNPEFNIKRAIIAMFRGCRASGERNGIQSIIIDVPCTRCQILQD